MLPLLSAKKKKTSISQNLSVIVTNNVYFLLIT